MNLKPMCECTYICSLPISVPSRDMNSIDSTQQSTQEPNPLKARVVGCLNSQSRAIMGKAFNDIHSPLQSRCVGKIHFYGWHRSNCFFPCKGSERIKRYRTLPNESTCVVYTFIESFA
ncbi:hypothetical protein TNCV_3310461 [Trichonephila clavipes]|nr:hypothetical protein TNCV_3310461 [Trichonephila clavipes]